MPVPVLQLSGSVLMATLIEMQFSKPESTRVSLLTDLSFDVGMNGILTLLKDYRISLSKQEIKYLYV